MTPSTTETAKTEALQMFRMGNDYIQIGNLLRMTEAEVEKEIHRLRNLENKKEKWRAYGREYMRRQREAMREARAAR